MGTIRTDRPVGHEAVLQTPRGERGHRQKHARSQRGAQLENQPAIERPLRCCGLEVDLQPREAGVLDPTQQAQELRRWPSSSVGRNWRSVSMRTTGMRQIPSGIRSAAVRRRATTFCRYRYTVACR